MKNKPSKMSNEIEKIYKCELGKHCPNCKTEIKQLLTLFSTAIDDIIGEDEEVTEKDRNMAKDVERLSKSSVTYEEELDEIRQRYNFRDDCREEQRQRKTRWFEK